MERRLRRQETDARSPNPDVRWFRSGYRDDLTHIEHTPTTALALRDGHTVALENGKTFVLCRFREPTTAWIPTEAARGKQLQAPNGEAGEVLVWLHPDGE
jgi:hypothetical protein